MSTCICPTLIHKLPAKTAHRAITRGLTGHSKDEAEQQWEHDEVQVEVVRVNDGRQSQEHEYDGLWDRGQHLHEVLDCGGRLLGHVGLRVLPHDDAGKGQSEMVKDLQLLKTYPCLGPIDFTTNIVTHLKQKYWP